VPLLRDRPEDIEPLVRHFAQRFAARMRRRIEALPTTTLDAMRRYSWPGNVRELGNLIERAVILSPGPRLIVPLEDLARQSFSSHGESPSTFVELERAYIMHVLEETNWIVGGARGAAARLGIKRTTLQSLMKRLAITRPA
jgi:formate hydrogenlyase transcriptional activator